jgi:hypothetical protein
LVVTNTGEVKTGRANEGSGLNTSASQLIQQLLQIQQLRKRPRAFRRVHSRKPNPQLDLAQSNPMGLVNKPSTGTVVEGRR